MERPSIKIASGLHTDFTYAAANHKYVIQHILEAKCRGTPAQRLGICFGHGRAIERVPVELNYYYELNSMPHNAAAQIHPAQQRSRCDVADPSSAAVAMSWRGSIQRSRCDVMARPKNTFDSGFPHVRTRTHAEGSSSSSRREPKKRLPRRYRNQSRIN